MRSSTVPVSLFDTVTSSSTARAASSIAFAPFERRRAKDAFPDDHDAPAFNTMSR
jgi:hypothetical protein